MQNENYISTYTIGQVIKKDDKYWQITSLTNPSNGDWFIADYTDRSDVILRCPSYLYFNNDDRRYIVQEVSITPITVKVNIIEDKDNEKLPVGKIITFNNEFYEVIDYRIPRANEQYVFLGAGSTLIYTRRYNIDFGGIVSDTTFYNIVVKIEPYKLGQVITVNNKSYTVVDYACPKKDQLFLKTSYSAVYSAVYDWLMEKAFILEPIEPPDPEATAYKPGQLIVRENIVYRVIAYRKAKKGEYMTNSNITWVVTCDTNESYVAHWVVEPYFVS